MIPRFANPHLRQQHTEIISRAALFADAEANDEAPDLSRASELDEMLKATLEVPASLHERPKKRRKLEPPAVDTPSQSQQQSVGFRLVSSKLPPRAICLEPKPAPVIKHWEPPCEDDEKEAEERSQRAQAAAVDMSWLLAESRRPYVPRPNESRKTLSAIAAGPPTPSCPMLVLEWSTRPTRHSRFSGDTARPSPHEISLSGSQCPVMSIRTSEEPTKMGAKRSRARR
ncbi:hypothetical protein DENSPDRAFT_832804, partial [Dentipellis sp. KUC8613]